jgi:hypothetical protein
MPVPRSTRRPIKHLGRPRRLFVAAGAPIEGTPAISARSSCISGRQPSLQWRKEAGTVLAPVAITSPDE